MNRRSKIQLIKYILYSFLMIVLYVLQTDPNFTLSSGTGPVLVLPFAVAVAMFDGQLAGGPASCLDLARFYIWSSVRQWDCWCFTSCNPR